MQVAEGQVSVSQVSASQVSGAKDAEGELAPARSWQDEPAKGILSTGSPIATNSPANVSRIIPGAGGLTKTGTAIDDRPRQCVRYWVRLWTCKWRNADEIMKSSKDAVVKASSQLALRVFASEHGAGQRSGRRWKSMRRAPAAEARNPGTTHERQRA